MTTYIAVVHKDPDSDFGVSFPDFPGCVTAGAAIDEAKDMAKEALALHLKGMMEDGEEMPEIRPRTVRVNIALSQMTLRQIDAASKSATCPAPISRLLQLKKRFIPI